MSADGRSSSTVNESNHGDAETVSNPIFNVDSSSPYYLHPSDHPAQVFVPELLNDGNFGEWLTDMSDLLFAKNKFGFVDGSLTRPAADSGFLNHWIRGDHMVKGWLRNSMEKEIRSSVRCAKTAQEIWADIFERFGKGSAPRLGFKCWCPSWVSLISTLQLEEECKSVSHIFYSCSSRL